MSKLPDDGFFNLIVGVAVAGFLLQCAALSGIGYVVYALLDHFKII